MAKLRSVSTAFWSDPFIEELTPSEKLLYIYFITNEKTNMLGIYEVSIKKICFETGLSKEIVSKAFETFRLSGKIKYDNNFIILVNFIKHQNYNPNMKKAAIECYNNLPKHLKISDLSIEGLNPLEAFETLSNHLGMVRKVEDEYKEEKESETIVYPSFQDFWDLYDYKKEIKKSEQKWKLLTQSEKEKIMEYLPEYIKSTPDKQYRKYPCTFLNNKSWNNESTTNDKSQSEQLSNIGQQQIFNYLSSK